MRLLGIGFLLAAAAAGQVHVGRAGWKAWAPRDEIAPRVFADPAGGRQGAEALAISGDSRPGVYGGWRYDAGGVQPGKWYRLTAWYRVRGVDYERFQVLARLDWLDANGRRSGWPDYAWSTMREGEWRRVTLDAPAPERTAAAQIQLYLQNAPQATVWWDGIELDEIPAPRPRQVRVAAINLKPRQAADPVAQFLEVVAREVPGNTDLIVLPEGITEVGTNKGAVAVSETLPGPTSKRLAEVARRKHSYVVAGIYEREGTVVYNTALLIDREGRLAGKYRKVYLPRDEVDGGLTPGMEFPVFQTDFGRVGMMICWDLQYVEPARSLALGGAELIVLPIWGGNQVLGKARAIENHVFLASSGYDFPTWVLDPNGEVLAQAKERGQAAVATIDLTRRYPDAWDGEMRGRFMKETRLDLVPGP